MMYRALVSLGGVLVSLTSASSAMVSEQVLASDATEQSALLRREVREVPTSNKDESHRERAKIEREAQWAERIERHEALKEVKANVSGETGACQTYGFLGFQKGNAPSGHSNYEDDTKYAQKDPDGTPNGFFKCKDSKATTKTFISKKSWNTMCLLEDPAWNSDSSMYPFMFRIADQLCGKGFSLYMDWLDKRATAGSRLWKFRKGFQDKYCANKGIRNGCAEHAKRDGSWDDANVKSTMGYLMSGVAKVEKKNTRQFYVEMDGKPPPGPFCSSEMAAFGGKTNTADINDASIAAGKAKATAVPLTKFFPSDKAACEKVMPGKAGKAKTTDYSQTTTQCCPDADKVVAEMLKKLGSAGGC